MRATAAFSSVFVPKLRQSEKDPTLVHEEAALAASF